jgi:hypothetical protein
MEVPVPNPESQRSCILHRFCLFPRFFGWNLELFRLWLFLYFLYFIIQELTWDCYFLSWDCYFLTWDCYFLPWDWYFLIWDCYFLTWDCYFICLSVLTYKFNNSIKCQTMLNDDCRRDVYSGMCKFVIHHQDIMNCSIF